MAEIKNCIF